MMNEKTTGDLWCRLENLHMIKSLSNKIFMKKQLYSLRMKEGTPILHLNAFNRILSHLLALEVKLKKKTKLFCYFLLFHQVMTTWQPPSLELEDVRQMLQNNELIKKTDSTEEASGLVVKGQGEIKE